MRPSHVSAPGELFTFWVRAWSACITMCQQSTYQRQVNYLHSKSDHDLHVSECISRACISARWAIYILSQSMISMYQNVSAEHVSAPGELFTFWVRACISMYQNVSAEHVSAPGELFSELILGYTPIALRMTCSGAVEALPKIGRQISLWIFTPSIWAGSASIKALEKYTVNISLWIFGQHLDWL